MLTFRSLITLASVGALLAFATTAVAQETTTEPAPTPPPPAVPVAVAGTTVAGIDISGMDQPTALATVNGAFAQPIVIRVDKKTFTITNARLGAKYQIDAAVAEAMVRTGAGNTPVEATYVEARLEQVIRRIVRATDSQGSDPQWVVARKPRITVAKPGKAPDEKLIEKQIVDAFYAPALRPQQDVVPLIAVGHKATLAELGYVVTVSKGERILRLWAPNKKGKAAMVRSYRVAVGAPAYPTPAGRFTLVTKQVDPWWYPPASDWAKGQEPVPPGPSNPLGTRWMGLDRQDIGIHGTPDAGSIGGYASHGCIRMLIHAAEQLYSKIDVGTPVLIY